MTTRQKFLENKAKIALFDPLSVKVYLALFGVPTVVDASDLFCSSSLIIRNKIEIGTYGSAKKRQLDLVPQPLI